MIKPATSTKVATKGADAVAGSSLTFLSKNGIKDPANVPNRTIAIKEIETLKAIQTQYIP